MSITLLYGCFQIELSVRNLDAARGFMQQALGARPIEQKLAREIEALFPNGGYRVDHLDCGEATFQLNEPSPALAYGGQKSVHQQYLDSVGPCVSNLNFYVDDIAHARQVLSDAGAETRLEGPSTLVESLRDYGPDNTRAGGGSRPFLFMGTRHLIGLDLEIMEPNFVRFADQTAQYPCFYRPGPGSSPLVLQRLTIAVPDLARTYDNLVRLFTPGSRSAAYGVRPEAAGDSFRITLGGIELEYCTLGRVGPGVTGITFGATHDDLLRTETGPARELLGFDVAVVPGGSPC